ncbi:MAG: CHASE domain-containing protein, partial [Betaproteobacteria bacterium]
MAPESGMDTDYDSDSASEPFSRLHLFLWPGLVVAISIAVTGFIVWNSQAKADLELQAAFQRRFVDIVIRIENQLNAQAKLLQGFKGLYAASGKVSRDEFGAYFNSLQLTAEESRTTVVAYHELVPAKDLARHVASVRNQGFPIYRIAPAGAREVYAPLINIEPFTGDNRAVLGFDPLTVAAEREAILRSRDTGSVAISSKLTLAQDAGEDVPGFVMYVPMYRNAAAQVSEAERRASFSGWIDAPVRMRSFMARALPGENTDVDFEIFDGTQMSAETLLFDSDDSHRFAKQVPSGAIKLVKQIQFGGQTWTIFMLALPGFGGAATRQEPLLIGSIGILFGLVLSGALFLGIFMLRRRALLVQAIVRQEQRSLNERALKDSELAARRALEQAQQALQQLNLQRFALDQHAIVSITDVRGKITFANDKLCEISGYSREELLGQDHAIFSSEATPPGFYQSVYEKVASGQVWHGEVCCRAKDGHLYWLDCTAVPYRNEHGVLDQCIVMRSDITARKMAELEIARHQEQLEQTVLHKTEKLQETLGELQLSEAKYRILVEESSDPIFSFHPDGTYLHANPAFASGIGKKPEEVIGKTLWDLFSAEEADRRFAVLRRVIEQGA